ncbi:MAG: hypothetical protein Kow0080_07820 [Candidatus Promineifilaceae bacterium]
MHFVHIVHVMHKWHVLQYMPIVMFITYAVDLRHLWSAWVAGYAVNVIVNYFTNNGVMRWLSY